MPCHLRYSNTSIFVGMLPVWDINNFYLELCPESFKNMNKITLYFLMQNQSMVLKVKIVVAVRGTA